MPGVGPILGRGERLEIDAPTPIGALEFRLFAREEEVAEGIVVATVAILLGVAPVLQADVAGGRLAAAPDAAVGPDLLPGVGPAGVGAIAEPFGPRFAIGLIYRFCVEFLGETVYRGLASGVVTLESIGLRFNTLEIGQAREREHLSPLRRLDEDRL